MGKFLKKARPLLQDIISPKNRDHIAEKLFKLAKECKISSHEGGFLALLISLLCLFEDVNALKLVKFKKKRKNKTLQCIKRHFTSY